jgi:CubicO group peptidase (beta-lactamase class C family)
VLDRLRLHDRCIPLLLRRLGQSGHTPQSTGDKTMVACKFKVQGWGAGLWLAMCLAIPPAQAPSGWSTSPPKTQRVDPQQLDRLQRHLQDEQTRIRSMAVVRHGHLVHEYYRQDVHPDDLHNVHSVTKSVLSLLVGIAIDQKKLVSADQTLAELLPEHAARASDARVKNLRLKDLLTLSSGFEGNKGIRHPGMLAGVDGDAIDLALSRPVVHNPGEKFDYNNLDGHVVSALLTRSVGMSAAQYAERTLFGDLGITRYHWPHDKRGINIGSSELQLTTRDMAKLGELIVRQGRWKGRQVVSADWIAVSTAQHSEGGPPVRRPYGYNWWVATTPDDGRPAVFAVGYGGQFIYAVPSLELVVVATSETRGQDQTGKTIREQVLPAVLR